MALEPAVFVDVPLNTNEPNPCSPAYPDSSWRGIVIQAPERVILERDEHVNLPIRFEPIPICGFMLLDIPATPVEEPMRLIVSNEEKEIVSVADVTEQDPSPEEPPPFEEQLDPADLVGVASGTYFNINLLDYVSLPPAPARYDVHVEFRSFESNVVTIQIVETP